MRRISVIAMILLAGVGAGAASGCGGGAGSATSAPEITTGVRGRAYDYVDNPGGRPRDQQVGAPLVVRFYRLSETDTVSGTLAGEAVVGSDNRFAFALEPGLYRVDGPWYLGFGVTGNICFDGTQRAEVRAGSLTDVTVSRDYCRASD